jgi:hypothetical protein
MTSNEPKMRILELTIKAIDGDLTPAESTELEGYIASSKMLADYYSACIKMHLSIVEFEAARTPAKRTNHTELDRATWQEMALYEKIAPEAEVSDEEETPVYQKIVKPERTPFKISRFSVISVILNAAAVLFIVLFVHYGKPLNRMEVATLTDSIDAKWVAGKGIARNEGDRFIAGDTFGTLQSGLIELLFDTNARVVIEGPAEFQIVSEQQIRLRSGKLYATVPQEAIGFTVNTRVARIVDLGTEFGVQVSTDGDTELHVIQGLASLITEEKVTTAGIEVYAGQAKQISAKTMTVTDIPCQEQIFARSFDSGQNFVYRGQTGIDLADIVGGGNGFGTGRSFMGIDPVSCKPIGEAIGMQESPNIYRPVPFSSYIDGIFVPDGRTRQIVTSQGHLFAECPPTEGACFNKITYLQQSLHSRGAGDGFMGSPIMTMHANMGITFDLEAIRQFLPNDMNIVRFQSAIGIEKEVPRPDAANADFWVLIDGQVRFQKAQVKPGELHSVDIQMNKGDRFLTLVITDGQDLEERVVDGVHVSAIDSDWGMFVRPRLTLE